MSYNSIDPINSIDPFTFFMNLLHGEKISWYQKLMLKIIDAGEVPEHLAIIMDGNRRYARMHHYETVGLGHKDGAKKLKQIIEWLSYLHGVKILSVYAFSLLNFQRDQKEVNDLMDLAESTFKEMADNPQFFKDKRCRILFIGRIEKLEEKVQAQIQRVLECNPDNFEFTLNICVAYTSHDEIEKARDICLEKNVNVTIDNVFENLQIPSKPNLLVRTSGAMRMSNFMLLQCANCPIIISEILWPDLSFIDLIDILLRYQLRNYIL